MVRTTPPSHVLLLLRDVSEMTNSLMEILADLKEWLEEEETKELLAPSSCLTVLEKIEELEKLHS